MLSLFRQKTPAKKKQYNREMLLNSFFYKTEHSWINENKYIKASFEDFFEYVPVATIDRIVNDYQIIFVPILAKYGCAISSANVILVFPELHELLASTAISNFKAIIAHEIGHILMDHGAKSLSVMEAQIEADNFAISLGFGEDLESFLLDQPESIEKRLRLSYLTSRYYSKDM